MVYKYHPGSTMGKVVTLNNNIITKVNLKAIRYESIYPSLYIMYPMNINSSYNTISAHRFGQVLKAVGSRDSGTYSLPNRCTNNALRKLEDMSQISQGSKVRIYCHFMVALPRDHM